MIRGDLSNRVVHLTRGDTPEQATTSFKSILREGALRGVNGFIRGGYNCVCFSEAPLGVIVHALGLPPEQGMRYAPFGVMVGKRWLFEQGGRPVIYQSEEEYEALPDTIRYRHVRYEPHRGIDHSWEREWRIRTDRLALDPTQTTFVVPNRKWVASFHEEHVGEVASMSGLLGIPLASSIPWHFIALEDLGVEGFAQFVL